MCPYLRECPGLVGENVLDLTKVIRQIPTPCKGRSILVKHLRVEIDESRLRRPHKLDGDVKRNWDNVLKSEVSPPVSQNSQNMSSRPTYVINAKQNVMSPLMDGLLSG